MPGVHDTLDLQMVLASSIHDMKNTLALFSQHIGTLREDTTHLTPTQTEAISRMEYGSMRLHQELVQLLAWYQVNGRIYTPQIQYQILDEFLAEPINRYREFAAYRGISIHADASPDQGADFDPFLMGSVLNNAVINALRYARQQIQIAAICPVPGKPDMVGFAVYDDGPGYPASVLATQSCGKAGYADGRTGGTGLGLYFAHCVATWHSTPDCPGYIQLDNASPLGGARFQVVVAAGGGLGTR